MRKAGIGRYKAMGKNRTITITLDHKLLEGKMNQLCVGILAEAIRYKEFHEPEAYVPTVRSALIKEIKRNA